MEVLRILRREETEQTRSMYTVEKLRERRQTPEFLEKGTVSFDRERAKVGKRASLWEGGTRGLTTSSHSSFGYKEDLEGAQTSEKLNGDGLIEQLDFNPGFF